MGDISFVDLPKKGEINEGDASLNMEASKVVSEFTSPLSGSIVGINEELLNELENLNSEDAEKTGLRFLKMLRKIFC